MLLFFVLSISLHPVDLKRVKTPFGYVEGVAHQLGDQWFDVYLGIPFGRSQRFQKSTLIEPWEGLINATFMGPACYNTYYGNQARASMDFISERESPSLLVTDEDCLYLHVMAPAATTWNVKGYPVLVITRGGVFEINGGNLIAGKTEVLLRNFVSKGIVVVDPLYSFVLFRVPKHRRQQVSGELRALGSTSCASVRPESDQILWRKSRRNNGYGSGDVVSALSLSPHTNQLFQRAIQIGGSMFSQTNLGSNCKNDSDLLAKQFGCQTAEDCPDLQSGPLAHIRNCIAQLGLVTDRLDYLSGFRFVPRIDGDFFPDSLENLLKKAPRIPTISGVTQLESALTSFFPLFRDNRRFYVPKAKQKFYSRKALLNLIVSLDDAELKEELISYYALRRAEGNEKEDSVIYLKLQAELSSDILFNIPIYYEALKKASLHWPVYLYEEEYYHGSQTELPFNTSTMWSINTYLFETYFGSKFALNADDKRYQRNVLSAFTSFIKTGTPQVNNRPWLQITPENPNRYMAFNVKSGMKEGFKNVSTWFWLEHVQKQKERFKNLHLLFPSIETLC
ncbi:hypothetical protein L596_016205 [Steinernema carpocapsae]|uniref:Carboxylesterase type B domain-containing protein n=1 Tax=Steinernema carpocapsae TaxID=34508 RepID=A0A4V6A3C7_STECR|nr:hypothetical protein L596_016205 [Steinernema carpocapsae]